MKYTRIAKKLIKPHEPLIFLMLKHEDEDEKTDLSGGVRFNLNFLGIGIFHFFICHLGSTLLRDDSQAKFDRIKLKEARLRVQSYKNYIHHAFQLFLVLRIRNYLCGKKNMT